MSNDFSFIGTPVTSGSTSSDLYAIKDGTFDSSSDTGIIESCVEITNYLKSISIFNDSTSTDLTDTDANTYSIHWIIVRDYIMPDANTYIDNILKPTYYTPMKKTEGTNSTEYSRIIVRAAALYCAWRLETRDYPGGDMPSDSPYAQTLKGMLDAEIERLLSGSTRLLGQRLKSVNGRFCNPHIEPYKQSQTNSQPIIQPNTNV